MKFSKFKLLKVLRMFVATMASIGIANLLGIHFAFTAGIVGLLSVMDSTKVTLKSACQRLLSIFLALVLAVSIFSIFGFDLWAFAIFLFAYIVVCLYANVMIGIVPGAVLMGQILSEKSLSWAIIYNEMMVMLIGVAVASIINLFMISRFDEILKLRQEIEQNLRQIFILFYSELYTHQYRQDIGQQLQTLSSLINRALRLTREEYNNRIILSSRYDLRYFEMRRMQLNILETMYHDLFLLDASSEQNKILANIFYLTSQQIRERNSAIRLKQTIYNFYLHLAESELPQNRQEFETRAILYHLLRDIEVYLKIKTDFYQDILRERGLLSDEADAL